MKGKSVVAGACAALLGFAGDGMSHLVVEDKELQGAESEEIATPVKQHDDFSAEQATAAEELFESLDTDGDGLLSLAEFKANSATLSEDEKEATQNLQTSQTSTRVTCTWIHKKYKNLTDVRGTWNNETKRWTTPPTFFGDGCSNLENGMAQCRIVNEMCYLTDRDLAVDGSFPMACTPDCALCNVNSCPAGQGPPHFWGCNIAADKTTVVAIGGGGCQDWASTHCKSTKKKKKNAGGFRGICDNNCIDIKQTGPEWKKCTTNPVAVSEQ